MKKGGQLYKVWLLARGGSVARCTGFPVSYFLGVFLFVNRR
jgi:hypothetical protein